MTDMDRPKVITDLLTADMTGTVANYIRKLEAQVTELKACLGDAGRENAKLKADVEWWSDETRRHGGGLKG